MLNIRILERCREDSRNYWAALDRRNRTRESSLFVSSPRGGERVQTSGAGSPTEAAALEMIAADEALSETIERLAENQIVAYDAIFSMSDGGDRAILIAYYLDVELPTVEQIANKWGVSLMTVNRLKSRAVKRFGAI